MRHAAATCWIEHLHPDSGSLRLPVGGAISSRSLAEMKLAMAEVYEVATFYHHFDVVKEATHAAAGDHRARLRFDCLRHRPARRRCCDALPARLGPDVRRFLRAPCVGRCDTAPVAIVGQNPVPHATAGQGFDAGAG